MVGIERVNIKLTAVKMSIRHWENMIKELLNEKVWERYPPEKPYGTVDTLLKEEIGYDLAESMKEVDRRAADYLAKVAIPARKPGNPTGNNQYQVKEERKGYNNNNSKHRGTDPKYLTSVIARDRPDILERMKAGEFRSVRTTVCQ